MSDFSTPPSFPPTRSVPPVAPAMTSEEYAELFSQPPPSSPPLLQPEPYRPDDRSGQPWWGMGDILLGAVIVLTCATIGNFAFVPFLSEAQRDALASGDIDATPLLVIVGGLIGLQVTQGLWPVIVARWKGRGVARDFGFRFEWSDLGWGALGLVILLPIAAGVNAAVSALVGLDPGSDESSNTALLTDNVDSPLVWFIVAGTLIGAPLTEELFFRGLCLRAIEKRAGTVVGVLGSTFLFTLPHYVGASWQGTVVLFSVIGTVGLILAILTVKFDRLGPAIVMHFLFNLIGVVGAFAAA